MTMTMTKCVHVLLWPILILMLLLLLLVLFNMQLNIQACKQAN